MNATDTLINGFLNSLEAAGTLSTTAIIIAAKHGQNPLNPSKVGASVVIESPAEMMSLSQTHLC